ETRTTCRSRRELQQSPGSESWRRRASSAGRVVRSAGPRRGQSTPSRHLPSRQGRATQSTWWKPVTATGTRARVVLSISCVVVATGLQGLQPGTNAQTTADGPPILFEHITQQAGIDFRHMNGASPDKHIVETMGSGGLFLDYDNDGWLDVFLVDGGSLAAAQVARRARHRLYRNRRNGTFEDVTPASRIVRGRGFGMGAGGGGYETEGGSGSEGR